MRVVRRIRGRAARGLLGSLLTSATFLVFACGPGRPVASRESGTAGGQGQATVLTSDEERAGESIYRRENCARCHTLFECAPRSGEFSLPTAPTAEAIGSRVGPDLGLEGHRASDEWHYAHLYAPDEVVPGSRMPASRHLFRPEGGKPVPTTEGRQLVAYLQALGRGERDIWAEWRGREPAIPDPPRADAALRQRGDELYQRHCVPCHGAEGDGKGAVADFLSFAPRDLVAARYRFRSLPIGSPPADKDLFRTISLGTGTGSAMPSFYWLSEIDRWALVLRVKEFSPDLRGTGLRLAGATGDESTGDATSSAREEVAIARGRQVWDDLGCASCHGPAGKGMTREEVRAPWTDSTGVTVPRSGDLTHACAMRGGASPQAVSRAIHFGVGEAMPSYAEAFSSEADRKALIDFVGSLQSGHRPGSTSPDTRSRP